MCSSAESRAQWLQWFRVCGCAVFNLFREDMRHDRRTVYGAFAVWQQIKTDSTEGNEIPLYSHLFRSYDDWYNKADSFLEGAGKCISRRLGCIASNLAGSSQRCRV